MIKYITTRTPLRVSFVGGGTDFYDYYKYNDAETQHIFIYGPLTDSMYADIENNMKTHINNNTQLVIHLQGENFLNNAGNDGDFIFGMESKGNLFKNAFNYQNCMKNAQKLRNFILKFLVQKTNFIDNYIKTVLKGSNLT